VTETPVTITLYNKCTLAANLRDRWAKNFESTIVSCEFVSMDEISGRELKLMQRSGWITTIRYCIADNTIYAAIVTAPGNAKYDPVIARFMDSVRLPDQV